jgi:succinate-acetate transporter protein
MNQDNWASPAPLGFAAFAMITLVLGLNFSGLIPPQNRPIFFALLFAGAVAQIIAGINIPLGKPVKPVKPYTNNVGRE